MYYRCHECHHLPLCDETSRTKRRAATERFEVRAVAETFVLQEAVRIESFWLWAEDRFLEMQLAVRHQELTARLESFVADYDRGFDVTCRRVDARDTEDFVE